MNKSNFKNKTTFEERSKESLRIREKYPDRIPCIIEGDPKYHYAIKNKYLIPAELSLGQVIYIIRKRILLSPEKSIFFFINNQLYPSSLNIKQLDSNNRDPDGFLYIMFSLENTFG